MAIDNTPPRLKLIVTIAVITVVTLFALNFVFTSYYAMMSDEAARSKLAPTTELNRQRKAEQEALSAAKIDQAMGDFAKGARAALIAPQPSEDLGAMTGWSKMPKPAPTPEPIAAPPPATEGTEASGDAGASAAAAGDAGAAAATGDAGGASPTATGDAGARDHHDHHRDHH